MTKIIVGSAKTIVTTTPLDGVVEIIPPTLQQDFRGEYIELYNEALHTEAGCPKFVQDDISVSLKHVLRGLHGDSVTWKLISCLYGKFYLVVLNNIEGHPQWGQWYSFTLSESNRTQVLVPPGFANGHLVLSDLAIFHYKQSTYYDRERQFTIKWNDERFKIWWPIQTPILSPRDQ